MEITDVRVFPVEEEKLKAFVSIIIDVINSFTLKKSVAESSWCIDVENAFAFAFAEIYFIKSVQKRF